MSILVMMIPITLLLVTLFVVFFLSAVFSDQFEDLETPKHQILINENLKASNTLEMQKGDRT
ncbi:MAG: cbb3-type cytochrome oxidase assembly protein CcoS [Bdellovibrionales bacterium]|nr:cbb3-type cytochrome oxidase assembly protein CcoS [Bdellovibrionales bacterium]